MANSGVIKETGIGMDETKEILRALNNGSPDEIITQAFRLIDESAPDTPHSLAGFECIAGILEKSLLQQLELIEGMKSNKDFKSLKDIPAVTKIYNNLDARLSSQTLCPIIYSWAANVLGSLCAKFSNRGKCPVNGSLGDSIMQWMYCNTTRSLMKILLTENKKYLLPTHVIFCLLNTCAAHSPFFDWAVARYAAQSPGIMAGKGLLWGLQKFLASNGAENNTEMTSLIGTFSYLCGCHSARVLFAMDELLKWSEGKYSSYDSLRVPPTQYAVVPFLLRLSRSPTLLTAIFKGPVARLKVSDLQLQAGYIEEWKKLPRGLGEIVSSCTNAILRSQNSCRHVLELLVSAVKTAPPPVASAARFYILERIFSEIEVSTRTSKPPIPFLDSFQKETPWLMAELLKDYSFRDPALVIIKGLAKDRKLLLVQAVSFMLLNGKTNDHLNVTMYLIRMNPEVLSEAISMSLGSAAKVCFPTISKPDPSSIWVNLYHLMSIQNNICWKSQTVKQDVKRSLVAITDHLSKSTDAKEAFHIMHVIIKALEDESAPPLSVHQTLMIASVTVSYFYLGLQQLDWINVVLMIRDVTRVVKILCTKFSYARAAILREFLESSLFRQEALLFGGVSDHCDMDLSLYDCFSLLKDNYNQGSRMGRWQSTSLKPSTSRSIKRPHPEPPPVTSRNTRMLLTVLRAACSGPEEQSSLDAVVSVALLLVELISPDVMYNGLPWPDEDFCKVTVERDLAIRRILDQSPLVWSLLSFIAYHRPALCYCSVILRAVVATLIGQWSTAAQQGRQAGQCEHLINVTSRILQIMTLGQLLIPPLSAISEIVAYIKPAQVVTVLKECVWAYMRDHVPSPALFTPDQQGSMWRDPNTSRPAKKYTEPLRRSILENISTLASVYRSLFITDIPEEE